MVAKKVSMRNIKEILRLKFEAKLSHRQIAQSLRVSVGTVSLYTNRATAAGLTWPLPDSMTEQALEALLFPNTHTPRPHYAEPDFIGMHQALKAKGVTKQLLWEEYKVEQGDNGLQYSQFCHRYHRWRDQQQRSMRQIHKAGEKCFIDYCGPTVPVIDDRTGEIRQAAIFVAVLGASNYTFAEATWSQKKVDWIESHVRMFTFFGGVPELLIPDNLKSAVTKADRNNPVINESYLHLASHYKTAILPARPYKPKDKAKAEVAVQIVERWILARLRHNTFFTLNEINNAIRGLLEDMNQRPFKKLPGTRKSQFEALDKPALKALPNTTYHYTEFKLVRVNIDYHIEFDKHYYSVPHHLVKLQLEAQASYEGIALFFKGEQVARHPRSARQGHHTTDANHMPQSHRKYHEWSPEQFLSWANEIGPDAQRLIQCALEEKLHPEQNYRRCFSVLNLAKQYDANRLNLACAKALDIGSPHLKSIKSILANHLEKVSVPDDQEASTQHDDHDNVRGSHYYF